MREIKFRAWDKNRKYMLIDLVPFQESRMPSNWHKYYDVMQYTGLKDKNGKEIYEGDKVRILYSDWISQSDYTITLEQHKQNISSYGVVVFRNCGFEIEFVSGDYVDYGFIQSGPHGEIEIIGNINETPELLK